MSLRDFSSKNAALTCKWRSPIKYLAFGDKEIESVSGTISKASFIFQMAGCSTISWDATGYLGLVRLDSQPRHYPDPN